MSKIFRLYKEGATTYQDWNGGAAFPYNSTNRETIEDPDAATSKNEITSIPSPFARIDLIKTAFRNVCRANRHAGRINLEGNTIFHKMVSDTLDVAEIFFNLDKYGNKIEVIVWNQDEMLDELKSSGIDGHRYLADVLRKYLISDGRTYNFDDMRNIYLLNYKHGPDELNIIGATSPATLFFSTANDLSYIEDIYFGEDRPFTHEYKPLYKRDFEFVKYLFALRREIRDFAGLFPELDDYLNLTYKAFGSQERKSELREISGNYFDSLEQIVITDHQQNNVVEVLGQPLYKKGSHPDTSASEFFIKSTKGGEIRPLVLPVESGNRYSELRYTTGNWGRNNAAPYKDDESDLTKRLLPFDGSVHPYLTISDFLEDVMIKVPHTLNEENYFNGNLSLDKEELAYLLPLRPLIFEYFTPEEIMGEVAIGKPMLEMSALAANSGVKVILRIPIEGNGRIEYMEYSRVYYSDCLPFIANNEGGMVELKFTGFVMPQLKFTNEEDALYNIGCVQSVKGQSKFRFYKGTERINAEQSCRNEDGEILVKADNYLLKDTNFDFIQVSNREACGLMLPKFRAQHNTERFVFAIDLGTSNTHIEYKRQGESTSHVFSFGAKDRQLCEMFVATRNEYGAIEDLIEEIELIEKDYVPAALGDTDFQFPTRTVLSCSKNMDWSLRADPFTLINLPFTYDKRMNLIYNNYRYNIKWGTDDEALMKSYVRCVMMLIRNKVLLNSGDLAKTKIIWFYPTSMAPARRNKLVEAWNEAYRDYFGEGSTVCMTESAAPIEYFFNSKDTATHLINIDIGGGTTDIAFATDNRIDYVTSFRFASNALFENAYSVSTANGIVDCHKGKILDILKDKQLRELVSIFESDNNQHPANMASFLFGLRDNTLIKNARINVDTIDFNKILQEDENFKIVFIIFYSAIIYHLAQIVKTLGIEQPRHISFSGNGSKIVRVVTPDTSLLARYTKLIFEKVTGKEYRRDLEILGLSKTDNPKETTCKGGLAAGEVDNREVNMVVLKSGGSGIVTNSDTYSSVTEEYKQASINDVKEFFRFVLDDVNSEFSFKKNFGVTSSSLAIAREVCEKDLDTFLEKGLKQRRKESEESDPIEETFFFYPIKGVLNAISSEIFRQN